MNLATKWFLGTKLRVVFSNEKRKFVIQEYAHTIAGNFWLDYKNLEFDDAMSALLYIRKMRNG